MTTAVLSALAPTLIPAAGKGAYRQVENTVDFTKNVFAGKPFFPSLGKWFENSGGNVANILSGTANIGDVYNVNDTSQYNTPENRATPPQDIVARPVNNLSGNSNNDALSFVNNRDFFHGSELENINPQATDIQKTIQDMMILQGMPPVNTNIWPPFPMAPPPDGLSALAPDYDMPYLELGINAEPLQEPIGGEIEEIKQAIKKKMVKKKKVKKKMVKKKMPKKAKVKLT